MNTVTICSNPLNPDTWTKEYCDDVRAVLFDHYKGAWPEHARIYLNYVAQSADVTPYDEGGVEALGEMHGNFYVVEYPEGALVILVIVAIVVAVAAVALSFLLRPKPPASSSSQLSPNNLLANRSNTARPNERIPDIYGEVWSVPDYIAVPYDVFDANGVENEYSYFCVGRGSYTIESVRENTTDMAQIPGTSVEVYAPFTSPNSGNSPQLRIGSPIATPIYNVIPCSSINGQDMYAPNQTGVGISGPPYWQGPYFITDAETTEVWINFVAEQGCYKINNDGTQSAYSVTLQVGITPCDGAGHATGPEQLFNGTLVGSATLRNAIGVTIKCHLAGGASAVSIRAQRTSNTLIQSGVQVADSIQWKDAYSIAPVMLQHFGDVTTVQVITQPTPAALAIQDRKLNLLVTRNLPQYIPSGTPGVQGTFSSTLSPTSNAIDILCAMALDPYIGRRQLSELDTDGMYNTAFEIFTYFGTALCVEFCYTFSDATTSFEEAAADVAAAIFCTCYRQGSLISLFFEQLNHDSTILFNHRNKIPGSETRTVNFGTSNDNDGIQLDYIDPYAPNYPAQDTTVTLYYPTNGSATNPKKISSVGIRNNVQAQLFGWRLYQRLILQHITVQFDCTLEAATIGVNERILVADNTRPDTQDGEVIEQDSLMLTLSQSINFVDGLSYTIFLQHPDNTIESIAITPGLAPNQVILAAAPAQPLVVAQEMWARTTYLIVSNAPTRSAAMLLAEKTPKDGGTYTLTAVDYDNGYYVHDPDFINGVVTYGGSVTNNGGGGAIAPGTRYAPNQYNDSGTEPTVNPQNAYDGNVATVASVRGVYIPGIGGDPPESDVGNCTWNGFPSVLLTGPVTLHILATVSGASGTWSAIFRMGTAVIATVHVAAGLADYSIVIPAYTNLAGITANVLAAPGNAGLQINIQEIYVQ